MSKRTPAAHALSQLGGDEALLDQVQHDAFRYFERTADPVTGLVPDSTRPGQPCSTAGIGFALSAYVIAVKHGWMTRAEAADRTLMLHRFFSATQTDDLALGTHGFFWHFIDVHEGRRAWNSEISSIDTTLLVAGMLAAASFFDGSDAREREIRDTADAVYRRIDWRWMQDDAEGGQAISHGWTPEKGFLPYRWLGYSEALLLYALALGSPTHPATPQSYQAWLSGYDWQHQTSGGYVKAAPLFIHQYSHAWIDFRGIADAYMRPRGIDYFENSRRATQAQHAYAIDNPQNFRGYGHDCWGWTACEGPASGPTTVDGRKFDFQGYVARGAPHGLDDGTVAPWTSIASLPFAPEIVMPLLRALAQLPHQRHEFGFTSSFNPSATQFGEDGWASLWHFVLHQGCIVMMLENFRDETVWALMKGCEPLRSGLMRAGFSGGWLTASQI